MAEALIGGLIATGWAAADDIGCIEIAAERRDQLAAAFPGLRVAESCAAAVALCAFTCPASSTTTTRQFNSVSRSSAAMCATAANASPRANRFLP